MKKVLLIISILLTHNLLFSQVYIDSLINNTSINYYEVCRLGDKYFEKVGKFKGSGYTPFQRWKYFNEPIYYPSGERKISNDFAGSIQKKFNNTKKIGKYNTIKSTNVYQWEELGPNRVERITGHYAAGLGRVEKIWVDKTQMNTIYMSSRSGGIWKSLDGGATWQGGSTDFLPTSGVNTFDVNPFNKSELLINVSGPKNEVSHGIYRSTDGGQTWVQTVLNPTFLSRGGFTGVDYKVYDIKYDPLVENKVYIGTSRGLYISTDNLATTTGWVRTYSANNIRDIELHPTEPQYVYMINDDDKNNIYVSSNGGVTFGAVAISGNNNNYGTLKVTPNAVDNVYFASTNGVWTSVDKGQTFTFKGDSSESCFGGFAVNDTDKDNLVYGYVDTDTSVDGGVTFVDTTWWSLGNITNIQGTYLEKMNSSGKYVHADLRDAICVNGVFYLATDGFLCKSTDKGFTWSILSQGTAIRENYAVNVSQSNKNVFMTGSQDNGTSFKDENGWVESYGGDGFQTYIHPLNENWAIYSTQNGLRYFSNDKTSTNSGITPSGYTNGSWNAPLLYVSKNHNTVYTFDESVYKSVDFGRNWQKLGDPSFVGAIENAAIANNDNNILLVSSGSNLFKSADGGLTFTDIKGTLPNYSISEICFSPINDNLIFVTYSRLQADNSKVYMSEDGGVTWGNITYDLGAIPVYSILLDDEIDPTIYIGTEIGVYRKKKSEVNWVKHGEGLPNVTTYDLKIQKGSNTLLTATWGRGVWSIPLYNKLNFPKIEKVDLTYLPTDDIPIEGVQQNINVTLNESVTEVKVKWSYNNFDLDKSMNFTNKGSNKWEATNVFDDAVKDDQINFVIEAKNSLGNVTKSIIYNYIVKEFKYCDAQGTSNTGSDYITNVELNTINNNSTKSLYSNFSDKSTTLNKGQTYRLKIRVGAAFSLDRAHAWIDFNNDAVFETSEKITMSNYVNLVSEGEFTVPNNAILNENLRLRVRNNYSTIVNSPCGVVVGEVEDYTVVVDDVSLSSQLLEQYQISIYPNPIYRGEKIQIEDPKSMIDKVEVYDTLGKQLARYNTVKKIQTEALLPGVYYLKFYIDNITTVCKIIIM